MKTQALQPSDGASMVDLAYQNMRRRILDNVWAPGYQALEQEIALQLGMSRTPVRESLIRLANEGLVEVIPRRGMRVLPVSPTDMKEIYEILTALESMAAEMLAARKPGDAELKPLLVATKAMEKALVKGDLDAWAAADESFHEQLVNMAGNKMLADAVFSYWDRAHRARMFSLRLRPTPVNSTKEHMALVDRLRAGDAAGAAAVNREHRQRASRELLVIFERFRLQQM
ncbi:MAG: GntR family transcriptional regulator [Polaromonas sp.]|nr:GntR family transcriptional regulator [Polaromonas sp.]MDP3355508.1 GntR family transcriptional regulator [Polaromonas sp.]MDP3752668.1 GntR family transcriptional regulator [Polaromonas sp.]